MIEERVRGSRRRSDRHGQRGAGLPLVATGLVALLLTTSVVIGLSGRIMDRSRAQAAADAAALAGVVEGRSGASRLASANGATLVVFEPEANAVRVIVEVDGWRAEARAERSLLLVADGR